MTTIAYEHNTNMIAIDSRLSATNQIMTDQATKYHTKSDGSIWFLTGRPIDKNIVMNLFDSFEDKCIQQPKKAIEYGAVIAYEGKAYFSYSTSSGEYIMEEASHNDGFGSGGIYALCALNMGKTIMESVEFAKTMDIYTGGDVDVFDVATMTFAGPGQ